MESQFLRNCNILILLLIASSTSHFVQASKLVKRETPTESADNYNARETCNVEIDFSNMNFGSQLRAKFISSPYIGKLTMKNSSISSFQEGSFDSLPNLEYLDLSYNELSVKSLFSFGAHSELNTLILDHNFVRYYSYSYEHRFRQLKAIYSFPALEYLSLRETNINGLEGTWDVHFPKLTHLDLSENTIEDSVSSVFSVLPDSIITLVMENTRLTTVKSQYLENVKTLILNHNKFYTISSHYCYESTLCLHNLKQLERLMISNCTITKIDSDAFKYTNNLLELDISNNNFVELADEIFEQMPLLTKLDLSLNVIIKLPNISVLPNLHTLILDRMTNKEVIESLVLLEPLKQLKILSIQHNKLDYISQEFLNKLPSLQELNLSHNMISTLPSWDGQNFLQELNLFSNAIHNLEDISLEEFKSLKILNIRKNLVATLKIKFLKNLQDDTTVIL